ncbi:membrane protein [Robbsia andropogonis]|uniref:Protein HflC n=1 Tax=Robbsia andropogonis TaxID=28092 RepID=A0A0F5JTH3_9BURK|nr:protease modulator HflC [Robbsia andropogonis]KKB61121.1 membrane protein [Robbsia andropogonis]MCP1117480.1 protease modulator HflC [Robbsia andropogonis]MCP1126946.1 protease modulator HflC [Robbsia andropogonis]
MNRIITAIVALAVVLSLASSMMFVVDQRRFAIVFALGAVKRQISEPGLYFKLPPPFQHVVTIDKRIQTIDNAEPDRYITSEKKNLLVDLFVKYRVADPLKYYISFKSDSGAAEDRLKAIIRAALNEEFAKRTVTEVVSNEREVVMQAVRTKVEREAASIGIQVLDVRLKRVDLLAAISDSVYRRMEAERKQVANNLRSTGAAEAEQIRADADRQREVVLSEAYEKTQAIMGDADAQASAIYAQAFGKDPAFYAFYKSLDAYRAAFRNKGDVIVADPNSAFFQYLRSPDGGTPPGASAPAKRAGAR